MPDVTAQIENEEEFFLKLGRIVLEYGVYDEGSILCGIEGSCFEGIADLIENASSWYVSDNAAPAMYKIMKRQDETLVSIKADKGQILIDGLEQYSGIIGVNENTSVVGVNKSDLKRYLGDLTKKIEERKIIRSMGEDVFAEYDNNANEEERIKESESYLKHAFNCKNFVKQYGEMASPVITKVFNNFVDLGGFVSKADPAPMKKAIADGLNDHGIEKASVVRNPCV